jgi:hypothetical protein
MARALLILLYAAAASAVPLSGCPAGSYAQSHVVCTLVALGAAPQNAVRIASGSAGSFESHYSPAGARCELLLAGNSTARYEVVATFAHIDSASSVEFSACDASGFCTPAFDWRGATWNAQHFPDRQTYRFFTMAPSLRIVLQVAAAPAAPNTFGLVWTVAGRGCEPCAPRAHDDGDRPPFVQRVGCD